MAFDRSVATLAAVKRSLSTVLAVLIVVGEAAGALAQTASAAPTPSTAAGPVLGRVQAYYERTSDFKASFKQVVKTQSPKRTFTREGTVFFKRPNRMRWDYATPDQVFYVCDGTDLWSYDVEEGTAYKLRVEKSELFQSLRFLTGAADIAKEFDVTEEAATPAGLVPLKMLPKGSEKTFRSVTLFVDPATGETRETEVVDPVGNVSRIRFSNPSVKPLPADGFTFKPPAGVKVQDLGGK